MSIDFGKLVPKPVPDIFNWFPNRGEFTRKPVQQILIDGVEPIGWYCFPQWGYCGAPPTIRCKCGRRPPVNHDPGDEDPKAP